MTRWRLSATVAATAAVLLIGACSQEDEPVETGGGALLVEVDEPGRFVATNRLGHRVVVDWSTGLVQLPLDRYLLLASPAGSDLVDVALDRAIERCMADAGFPEFAFPERPIRDDVGVHARRYGPIDPTQVAANGFGVELETAHQQALEEFQATPLDPDVELAMYGEFDPSMTAEEHLEAGGCVFVAGATLTGTESGEFFGYAQALANTTLNLAADEPEVRDALQRWSDCMIESGAVDVAHSSPLSLIATYPRTTPDPDPEEIRAAVADVRCKQQTRLVFEWAAAEARLQADVYERDAETFELIRDEQLELLNTAADQLDIALPSELASLIQPSE